MTINDCISAQMLTGKCVMKLWSNFHSLCTWAYFSRWAQLSAPQVSVLYCTRAILNLWKLGTRHLRWECTVQYTALHGINRTAGDWVNPLDWNIWGKFVLWWENCSVCPAMSVLHQCSLSYLQSFGSLLTSGSEWFFLYPVQSDCMFCRSLPNQQTIKCV